MEANSPARLALSALYRKTLAEEARRDGSSNTLWVTATGQWASINQRFQLNVSAAQLELDLHDLWFLYCEAAKNTAHDHPAMDRLAFQVIQAREQGILSRHRSDHTGSGEDDAVAEQEAVTTNGRIWADLPFFVQDMTEIWTSDCASMGPTRRSNLVTFLARLGSVGLLGDELCGIALITLRETLETQRPLGELGTAGDDDEQNTSANTSMQDLTIAELLPAANAWLFACGRKLVQLCEQQWNNCPHNVGRLGELCLDSNAAGAARNAHLPGFTAERWSFWLWRLQDVVHDATQRGDNSLATFASRVMDNMTSTLDEANSSTRKLMEASIGPLEHKVHVQQLGPGLPPPAVF